jgi:hypothetical protein
MASQQRRRLLKIFGKHQGILTIYRIDQYKEKFVILQQVERDFGEKERPGLQNPGEQVEILKSLEFNRASPYSEAKKIKKGELDTKKCVLKISRSSCKNTEQKN